MAGFDLYYLFVENVFGGPLFATLGLTAIFIVLGMFSRMSFTLIIYLCSLFIMISLMGFVGSLAVFLFAVIAMFIFFAGLVKFITAMSS